MAYTGSNQSRKCFQGQPTLGNRNFNNTHWPQELNTSFPGNSGCNKIATNVSAATHLSPGSPYHRYTPTFDPRSPDLTFARSFTQPFQGYPSNIHTDPAYRGDSELSPVALSPSPITGSFYAGVQHFGGSTPSLVSSNSSPPTGRSINILLTPDTGLQPGNQLPGSPNNYEKSTMHSPMSYNHSTGTTPEMNILHLERFEDSGFQLATSVKGPRTLQSQESSVLLGSNSGSQNSQPENLDPLDLDDNLTDLEQFNGQISAADSTAGLDDEYHIGIVSTPTGVQSVPVTVALDNQSFWDHAFLLSPLTQLQALPYDGNASVYQDHLPGVAIEPTDWGHAVAPQAASPSPGNTCLLNDRRPSLTPSTSQATLSPEFVFRGRNDQRVFRNYKPTSMTSPETLEVLEAVQAGQQPSSIINPKGVSERTLAAAEANRKREAKFRCQICGNSQTSKQNLDNHIMSRHMQLKRFTCPVLGCTAKYGHARGVNRHLDSKHPGYRQACSKGKRGQSKQG